MSDANVRPSASAAGEQRVRTQSGATDFPRPPPNKPDHDTGYGSPGPERTWTWKMILIRSRGAVAVLVTEPDPAPAIICKNSIWPWLFFCGVSARMRGGVATAAAGPPAPNTAAPPDTAEWAAPCGADAVVSVALIAASCESMLLFAPHSGCWSTKVWQQSVSSIASAGENLCLLPRWQSGECGGGSVPLEDRACN